MYEHRPSNETHPIFGVDSGISRYDSRTDGVSMSGSLMETKGYDPLWSTLMSAVAYCGSMQFVAISLLTAAFDPVQAFLLSLMVNARPIFYGLSLLEKYRGLGAVRIPAIYTLCDLILAVLLGERKRLCA